MPDPKIKYQQLLFYAKKLKPMAAALHTEENKVQGCVSQVRWPCFRLLQSCTVLQGGVHHTKVRHACQPLCNADCKLCFRSGSIHVLQVTKFSGKQTLTLLLPRCTFSNAVHARLCLFTLHAATIKKTNYLANITSPYLAIALEHPHLLHCH